MRNPLGKSRRFQPSNGLKLGILGGSEGGVVEIKLGLEGEDVFIELMVVEDFGIKPPVVKVPDSPVELLVLNRCPLKGFPNPVGKNFWWIECGILGGGVNLLDVGEIPCPIVLAVPHDASIVKLFDPFGRDIGSLPEGDSECGEPIVSDIPVWSLDEGLLVIEETGLGILEVFFELVDLRLVFRGFGPSLAEILLMAAVRSFNEGIDNGAERGWIQVGGGDSVSDGLGRQLPQWDVEFDRHIGGPRVGGVARTKLSGYASGGVILIGRDGDGDRLVE